MSAPSRSPQLRARIAQALADLLAEHSAASIAHEVGIDRSTPSRRGSDLHQWPCADLLALALHHPTLAASIRQYLDGDVPVQGQATDALPALWDELQDGTDFTKLAIEAARDGRITATEAHQLSDAIRHRRDMEDKRLMPALLAITQPLGRA